jgi:hypothetical protein
VARAISGPTTERYTTLIGTIDASCPRSPALLVLARSSGLADGAPMATNEKPALSAAHFRFDATVSREAASTPTNACAVSAQTGEVGGIPEMLVMNPEQDSRNRSRSPTELDRALPRDA